MGIAKGVAVSTQFCHFHFNHVSVVTLCNNMYCFMWDSEVYLRNSLITYYFLCLNTGGVGSGCINQLLFLATSYAYPTKRHFCGRQPAFIYSYAVSCMQL